MMTTPTELAWQAIDANTRWIEQTLNAPENAELVTLLLGSPYGPGRVPEGPIRLLAATDAELTVTPRKDASAQERSLYPRAVQHYRSQAQFQYLQEFTALYDRLPADLAEHLATAETRQQMGRALGRWDRLQPDAMEDLCGAIGMAADEFLRGGAQRNAALHALQIPPEYKYLFIEACYAAQHAEQAMNLTPGHGIMAEAESGFGLLPRADYHPRSPVRHTDQGRMLEARFPHGPMHQLLHQYAAFQEFVAQRTEQIGAVAEHRGTHIHWSFGVPETGQNLSDDSHNGHNGVNFLTACGLSAVNTMAYRLSAPFLGTANSIHELSAIKGHQGTYHAELRKVFNSSDLRQRGIDMDGVTFNTLSVVCGLRKELETMLSRWRENPHGMERWLHQRYADAMYGVEREFDIEPEHTLTFQNRRHALEHFVQNTDMPRLLGQELHGYLINAAAQPVVNRERSGRQPGL